MVSLDDYLGKLVSSLSRARVLADLESVKIAQLYAANNLLKHFSIPRMRIVDVELTIPVAICEISIGLKRQIRPIDGKKVASLTYKAILSSLNLKSLPDNVSKDFEPLMYEHINMLIHQVNSDNYEQLVTDYVFNISKLISRIIESTFGNDSSKKIDNELIVNKLISKLKEGLGKEIKFDANARQLTDLNVTVEADKLKGKDHNTLLVIKMKISEESMIWERIDDGEGNIVSKLMPE